MQEIMYRYDCGTGEVIMLSTFPVRRSTPKGKWIWAFGKEVFVLNESVKRFAHETKAAALESLRRRTARRIAILTAQLGAAQVVYERLKDATPETVVMRPEYFQFVFED